MDRDGVININHGYVYKVSDFNFIDGIFDLVKRANAANFAVIVVTNQSGIGRGYYNEDDFWQLTKWMCEQFAAKNASIDGVYFCPHHPEQAKAPYLKKCLCRKPNTGMLQQAAQDHNIDLPNSVIVGDKASDIQCGERANLKRLYYFRSSDSSSHAEDIEHSSALIIDSLDQIKFSGKLN